MKVATWNVNSVRARAERVAAWLDKHRPDILCMQELKTEEKDFPFDIFSARGYEVALTAQRTYNGVAVASLGNVDDVEHNFGDDEIDDHARMVLGRVGDVHVLSVYIPNGQKVGSDKYVYKLRWLERLRAYLDKRFQPTDKVLVCGDFNVAPEERDVCDPSFWAGTTLFHEDVRTALAHVCAWGLTDTLRIHKQDAGVYSWWDYRMLGFQKNQGLRIDQIWASQSMAELCDSAWIDREERKGAAPSDHAPVLATFR